MFPFPDIRSLVTIIVASLLLGVVRWIINYLRDWYAKKHPLKVVCYFTDKNITVMSLVVKSRKRIDSCEATIKFELKSSGNSLEKRGIWNSIYPENMYNVYFEDANSINYLMIPLTVNFRELKDALAEIGGAEEAFSKERDIVRDYGLTPDELLDRLTCDIIDTYHEVFKELNGKRALISIQFKIRRRRPTTGPIFIYERKVAEVEIENGRISIIRMLVPQCKHQQEVWG